MSVIIPTFNERENVEEMVRRLDACLHDIRWEAIFVDDDFTDGTGVILQNISRADPRIRAILRIGRRGLASAVVEGILSTSAPYIAVIDCDLQHDETRLPAMLDRLRQTGCDLVVASRYLHQDFGDWETKRIRMSRFATWLAHAILKVPLSDPMSGFFCISRAAFDKSVRGLSARGYKILLDIIMSSPETPHVEEIPYEFRARMHGDSKLDSTTMLEYVLLLLDKTVGAVIPVRFVLFALVGGSGVFVNLAILDLLFTGAHINFTISQAIATIAAMTSNFFINNSFTYRDKRLRGFWPVAKGLFSFYAFCALGAAANVGIASVLFQQNYSWWLSAIAGTLVGVVWNFAMSSTFTWKK